MKKPLRLNIKKNDQLKKALICIRNSIKNDQERLDKRLFLVPEPYYTKTRYPTFYLPLCKILPPSPTPYLINAAYADRPPQQPIFTFHFCDFFIRKWCDTNLGRSVRCHFVNLKKLTRLSSKC